MQIRCVGWARQVVRARNNRRVAEYEQEHVCHLEFSNDAKSLFMSSSLDGRIQHYSTERSRLLEPAQLHTATPTAMAVSPSGHLIISATDNPPVVHLRNLAHNSAPYTFQPNASAAGIDGISFHPERADIFMLCFRDGSAAAYDAKKLSRGAIDSKASHRVVADGQISHVAGLHRPMISGEVIAGTAKVQKAISGSAFLPGFKLRAVTAGRDGRCRVVDFEGAGTVSRTWHTRAPVTSLNVISHDSAKTEGMRRPKNAAVRRNHGTTECGSSLLLATAHIDGSIHIYDTTGKLLDHKTISTSDEEILSIEWMTGPPHQTTTTSNILQRHFSEDADLAEFGKTDIQGAMTRQRCLEESDMGTVRIKSHAVDVPSRVPSIGCSSLADLFSPIKSQQPQVEEGSQARISGAGRSHPRIYGQKFVKSPAPGSAGSATISKPRNLALFPSTESDAGIEMADPEPILARIPNLQPVCRTKNLLSPSSAKKRKVLFKATTPFTKCSTSTEHSVSGNAKVLADLRKLAVKDPATKRTGTLSSYAASQRLRASVRGPQRCLSPANNGDHDHGDKPVARVKDTHAQSSWPTDSESAASLDLDIWLTSDSEDTAACKEHSKRRRERQAPQQAANQVIDPEMTHRSATNTVAGRHFPEESLFEIQPHTTDGSTQYESAVTAQADSKTDKNIASTSEHVRKLFPRSSSLSPRKKSRRSPQKRASAHVAAKGNRALTEMSLNVAQGRGAKNPWRRITSERREKAPDRVKQVSVFDDTEMLPEARHPDILGELARSPRKSCSACAETKVKVEGLECEVAVLKGEILTLKAILRKNGIPYPPQMR